MGRGPGLRSDPQDLGKSNTLAWLQAQGHIEKPKQKATIVATYDYVAPNGDPLFQVVRFARRTFVSAVPTATAAGSGT